MENWTENRFNQFWTRMIGIYGKRWAEDHGAEINQTWRDILISMSFKRVAATIKICIEAGDAHPITLSQFVKRAKSIKLNQSKNDLLRLPNLSPEKIADNRQRLKLLIKNATTKITVDKPESQNKKNQEFEASRQKALEYTQEEKSQ